MSRAAIDRPRPYPYILRMGRKKAHWITLSGGPFDGQRRTSGIASGTGPFEVQGQVGTDRVEVHEYAMERGDIDRARWVRHVRTLDAWSVAIPPSRQ
jgi:hypothetical protein